MGRERIIIVATHIFTEVVNSMVKNLFHSIHFYQVSVISGRSRNREIEFNFLVTTDFQIFNWKRVKFIIYTKFSLYLESHRLRPLLNGLLELQNVLFIS